MLHFLQPRCLNGEISRYVKLPPITLLSEKLIFQAYIKALSISCENMLTWISSMLVYVQKCITIKAKIVHSSSGFG